LKTGISLNVREASDETVEKAVEAERLGLDYVWIADTPMERYPPIVAALVASKTTKIRIGVGLLSPFLHPPGRIADSLSILTDSFGRRFDLCLGPGDLNQLSRIGVAMPKRPAEALLAACAEIRKPLKGRGVKVWLGGQGPAVLKVGRRFDGVMANFSSTRTIAWAKRVLGRTHANFQFGIWSPSYVYAHPDARIEKAMYAASALVALGASDYVLKKFNLYERLANFVERVRVDRMPELYVNSLPKEATADFRIHLAAEALPEYVRRIQGLGVSALIFAYPQSFSLKTIRELGRALLSIRKAQRPL